MSLSLCVCVFMSEDSWGDEKRVWDDLELYEYWDLELKDAVSMGTTQVLGTELRSLRTDPLLTSGHSSPVLIFLAVVWIMTSLLFGGLVEGREKYVVMVVNLLAEKIIRNGRISKTCLRVWVSVCVCRGAYIDVLRPELCWVSSLSIFMGVLGIKFR